MPNLFKIGNYVVFFWSDEYGEPVHVHICEGRPSPNATKIWLTRNGRCVVAHNKSKLSDVVLNKALEIISAHYFMICRKWKEYFKVDVINFYC